MICLPSASHLPDGQDLMGSREIGSYFEDVAPEFETNSPPSLPRPWSDEPHLALATGRHALAVAARELLNRGIRRILLPDYLCASMVDPFSGMVKIDIYPLTTGLEPSEGAFKETGPGDAILVCAFFGRSTPSTTVDSVKAARRRGAVVVSDTTHSPFTQPSWPYDLNIISLRKTLPIHDGAALIGPLIHTPEPLKEVAQDAILTRSRAAKEKRNLVVSERSAEKSTHDLQRFERYLESLSDSARMSTASTHILRNLDLPALAQRRSRNLHYLLPLVHSIPGVTPLPGYEEAYAPAYLTCRLPAARNIQVALASQGIYCPIHWPQPLSLKGRRWRHDLISLPIDHRYNEIDMGRIASSLRDCMKRGKP